MTGQIIFDPLIPWHLLAVVALIASEDRDFELQAVRAGAHDCLVKGSEDTEAILVRLKLAVERETAVRLRERDHLLQLSVKTTASTEAPAVTESPSKPASGREEVALRDTFIMATLTEAALLHARDRRPETRREIDAALEALLDGLRA